ncbi:MAG: HlyD family efflux transporter periplasmic adaptor subunit [Cyclobacteriaceae bacterium]|nr:HlyD family efflux transporter periplasmic adaptor subunit [Cyclobacteriaceae bacterium]
MKKYLLYIITLLPVLHGCMGNGEKADAYGNFEAVEVIISSEANGKLLSFQLEEGDKLEAGQVVGYVDTMQLYLNRKQLQASIKAIKSKTQNVQVQIDVLQKQRINLLREKKRVENLLADSAATTKQYDDIVGQLDVVEKQIVATTSRLNTSNRGLLGEISPLKVKIEQIEDQIRKSVIINPDGGTVLTKFAYENEVTAFGKPLYKIADLKNITLRAYVSGNQLADLKIGQNVKVKIDQQDGMKELSGQVTWISSTAEFTPKVIQTKEERVNLVYAFKVLVKNNGELKIGMPGELFFN